MANLLPGQKLLSWIRQEVRQRADRVVAGAPLNGYPDPYANAFVTTPELNGYVNNSCKEFADLLATEYGNYYRTATYAFLTDGSHEQFPLPLDHLKLLGVEWQMTPPTNFQNVSLHRFNLGERNLYGSMAYAAALTYPGAANRYAEFGDKLWLKPMPQAGLTMQLLYVPLPDRLWDTGIITLNAVVNTDALTINGITFTAGTDYTVGANDTATAVALAAAINASTLGGLAGILTATASGITVVLSLSAPATIVWSTSNTHLLLTPSQLCGPTGYGPAGASIYGTGSGQSTTPFITWTNIFQTYSGWDEYVIVDAAIKMMQKEESDTSVLEREKAFQLKRVQRACNNRDAANPHTITDVQASRYYGWSRRGGGWFR